MNSNHETVMGHLTTHFTFVCRDVAQQYKQYDLSNECKWTDEMHKFVTASEALEASFIKGIEQMETSKVAPGQAEESANTLTVLFLAASKLVSLWELDTLNYKETELVVVLGMLSTQLKLAIEEDAKDAKV
jgi:hypothetical protein